MMMARGFPSLLITVRSFGAEVGAIIQVQSRGEERESSVMLIMVNAEN